MTKTRTPKAAAKTAKAEPTKTAPAKAARAKKAAAPQIVGTGDSARVTVPLAALAPSAENVRRYQSEAGLTELVASIAAHGLLQNLTVRPNGQTFEVVAGARRLAALRILAKQEASGWTDDSPVPVKMLTAENDAEISLAENTVRENMHAADQIEAFRKLIEVEGMTPEAVGDRFGISHMTVRRRVKLAKVSPAIMDDFRAGTITLDMMQALAVSDDHGEQERVLAALPHWQRNADAIRAQLTREKIAADNRLAVFVGLDAYEAAGGTITRDLFSEDGDGYLDDKALVMRLASERVEAEAEAIRAAEGWKWAEGYLSEHDARTGYLPSLATNEREPTAEESAELDALTAWIEDNEPAYDAGQMTDEEEAEYTAKIERIDAINEGLIGHNPEEIPFAGVRVFVTHTGALAARRGLLKPEDAHELASRRRAAQADDENADGEQETNDGQDEDSADQTDAEAEETGDAAYSAALISDLTATKGAALAVAVCDRPDVALALIVHKLALQLVGTANYRAVSCLKISANEYLEHNPTNPDDDNAGPFDALASKRTEIEALLPKDSEQLFDWCINADQETLLRVLAYLVGSRLDVRASALVQNAQPFERDKIVAGNKVARVVGLDMADHWDASEAFFKRTTKAQIAEAATEAGAPNEITRAILSEPKAEAIRTALKATKGKRWIPAPLRVPVPLSAQIATQTPEAEQIEDSAEPEQNDAPEADSPTVTAVYAPELAPFFAGLPSHIAREATAEEMAAHAAE